MNAKRSPLLRRGLGLLLLVALVLGWCSLPPAPLPPAAGAAPGAARAGVTTLSRWAGTDQAVGVFKAVTPEAGLPYHGVVTYTVVLANSSVVSDTAAVLTDTLPAGVAFGHWVVEPPGGLQSI